MTQKIYANQFNITVWRNTYGENQAVIEVRANRPNIPAEHRGEPDAVIFCTFNALEDLNKVVTNQIEKANEAMAKMKSEAEAKAKEMN